METRAIKLGLLLGVTVGLLGCGNVSAEKLDSAIAGGGGGEKARDAAGGRGGRADPGVTGGTAGTETASHDAGVDSSIGTGGAAGSAAPNLVTNGDFASGSAGWVASVDGTATPATLMAGELCVTLTSGAIVALGWPDSSMSPVALVAGTTYQFSFGARTNVRLTAVMFEDKIGAVGPPYSADFDVYDALAPGSQTITHTFTPTKDDLTAGVVFLLHGPPAGTTFCVDHVALRLVH